MVVRSRKEGDMINPFGMTGSMKLKKYLNAGIPAIQEGKNNDIIMNMHYM